jgi:hypothetical protein
MARTKKMLLNQKFEMLLTIRIAIKATRSSSQATGGIKKASK